MKSHVSIRLGFAVALWLATGIVTDAQTNWPTTKETFRIVADSQAKVYDSTTLVKTKRRGVAVTANLLVNLSFASASGLDGQLLRAMVTIR